MWPRWSHAQRVAARSSAALGRPPPLLSRSSRAPMRALHVRALSGAKGPLQAEKTPPRGNHHDDQVRARKCLSDLSGALWFAHSPEQLTATWSTLSQYDPVVVTNGSVLPVGSRVQPEDGSPPARPDPADAFAVRMVSASELRELIRQGKEHTFVQKSLPFAPGDSVTTVREDAPSISIPPNRVLLVSEKAVARKILTKLFWLSCHNEMVEFLEAYEAKSAASEAAVVDLSTLDNYIHALYLESLSKLKEHAKMLEQFQLRGGRDLIPFLFRYDVLRKLLFACMMERNGRLARDIVDQALDHPTLSTFTIKPFTNAVQACLHGEKTLERLQHAMHIYRRMRHEVGYVLQPVDWSSLINASISLGQHEYALEVFREYRAHGVVPFDRRFQIVMRGACWQAQYDTVIKMVRAWIEQEQQQKLLQASTGAGSNREREVRSLNDTLRVMLKGSPSREQVEQMLGLMQSRRYEADQHAIRNVVAHHFTTGSDDGRLDADAVVSQFLELWERVPKTILRNQFVLYLVLRECGTRRWKRQHDRVLEYAKMNDIELPYSYATKLMMQHTSRGELGEAIKAGESVMLSCLDKATTKSADETQRQTLLNSVPDSFIVRLLHCYVALERFEDVALMDDAFELTARRSSANASLAKILRNAQQANAQTAR